MRCPAAVPLACHAPGCSLFPPPTLLPSHPGFHPVSSQAAFPGKPGKSPENEYSSAFPTLISETAWKLFQAVRVVEATARPVQSRSKEACKHSQKNSSSGSCKMARPLFGVSKNSQLSFLASLLENSLNFWPGPGQKQNRHAPSRGAGRGCCREEGREA